MKRSRAGIANPCDSSWLQFRWSFSHFQQLGVLCGLSKTTNTFCTLRAWRYVFLLFGP